VSIAITDGTKAGAIVTPTGVVIIKHRRHDY